MNFILSLEVVFPICCYMAVGYLANKFLRLSKEVLKQVNLLVFRVFLPIMLFGNILSSDMSEDFNLGLLVYAFVFVIGLYVVSCLVIPRLEREPPNRSVMIQGMYRSNYILFGIPITAVMYGEDQLGMVAVLAATVIPLFNVFAVLVFEMNRKSEVHWGEIFKGIVKNPLIQASAAALMFVFLKIELPQIVMKPIMTLGGIASPLALFLLGADFQFASLGKYRFQLGFTVFSRLVVVPAAGLFLGYQLGFRGVDMAALMVLFGSPVAVASYTMAQQMDGNGELAGQILAVTSLLCVFTIFFWTYILYHFHVL